jgi:hypothetical protein
VVTDGKELFLTGGGVRMSLDGQEMMSAADV